MIVEPDCWETYNPTNNHIKIATRNQQHTFVKKNYSSTHIVYTL